MRDDVAPDDVEVDWSCRVTAGGWELVATAVDDPFEHWARAVQERYGGRVDMWGVEYFRGGECVSDGSISVPPPYMPPLATLRYTLGSLRREAEYWATHPTR